MNIFLPYENDIKESVKVLDDLRLNKQILECYQLLTSALKENFGGEVKSYGHHPVYLHFKDNIPFLCYYGYIACQEYEFRFGKQHKLFSVFSIFLQTNYTECVYIKEWKVIQPFYIPYYMEGSKGQPNYIRTTNNVGELFRKKLIKKWNADKQKGRTPKWTNRDVPEFYKKEMGK